jgi:hypothetical protein
MKEVSMRCLIIFIMSFGTAAFAAPGPTDITITQLTPTGSPGLGATLVYDYTITNNGPNDALDVNFQETGGNGAANIIKIVNSVTSVGPVCVRRIVSQTVSCNLGSILAGSSATVTITSTPLAPGVVFRTATASSISPISPETNDLNNLVSSSVNIVSSTPADLQLNGSASTGSPLRGAPITYTYQLKVAGQFGMNSITFTAQLPPGFTYNGAFSSANGGSQFLAFCTESGDLVTCNTGPLLSSDTGIIKIVANAPVTPGNYTIHAIATTTVPDPLPANNIANVIIQVK